MGELNPNGPDAIEVIPQSKIHELYLSSVLKKFGALNKIYRSDLSKNVFLVDMDPSLPQNKDSEVDKTVMKIEGYNGVRIARGVDYLFKEDMVGPIYPKLD